VFSAQEKVSLRQFVHLIDGDALRDLRQQAEKVSLFVAIGTLLNVVGIREVASSSPCESQLKAKARLLELYLQAYGG